jgi:hypothetical protein
MNDSADSPDGEGPGTAQLVALYLETLEARMPPEEYHALTMAIHRFWHLMEAGGEGSFDMDDDAFTDDVRKEMMMVMAIIGTGRTDHRVVEMPGPDGSRGWAVVTDEVADDPEKLAELAAKMNGWAEERERTDAVLEGIEAATKQQNEH